MLSPKSPLTPRREGLHDALPDPTESGGVERSAPPAIGEITQLWGPADATAHTPMPTSVSAPPTALGRYTLVRELGRGGMGVVYEAQDQQLHRNVALKLLLAGTDATDIARERFFREARAVAALRHPNIVELYDIGDNDGHPYFTMRLVRGPSLHGRLREGPIAPKEAARIALGLARALAYAHSRGLLHRDVKPSNVLLENGDTPVLTDFGLVKDLEAEGEGLTRTAQVIGTPAFIAPERLREGAGPDTETADQYSLGIVLYTMLAGEQPYRASNMVGVLTRVLREELPPLDRTRVPSPLAQICLKAAGRRPEDRYPNMTAMADDLERYLNDEPVTAASPGAIVRAQAWARRRRRRLVPLAVTLLSLLAMLVVQKVWTTWREDSAQRAREATAEAHRLSMESRVNDLLAAGAVAEAEEVFAAFARLEEHVGTSALVQAWLSRGTRLADQGEHDAGLVALATAYGLAVRPEEQRDTLLALSAGFHRDNEWTRLNSALATLQARAPDAMSRPDVRSWQRDLLLTERQMPSALSLTTDAGERALISLMSQATRFPFSASSVSPWDIDGDGRSELALIGKSSDDFYVVRLPSGDEVPVLLPPGLTLHRMHVVNPTVNTPPLLVASDGTTGQIFELRDGQLRAAATVLSPLVSDAVRADLDQDGVPEVYTAHDRRFSRAVPDGRGGYGVRIAEPHTNGTNSEMLSLLAEDLDGDGETELVAGLAAWGAYDARVFHGPAKGSGSEDLQLVARQRLGLVTALAPVRGPDRVEVAALQEHDPRDPLNFRLFPRGTPQGAGRGVHLLRWSSGELTQDAFFPWPERPLGEALNPSPSQRTGSQRLVTGDLDGDGQDEVMVGVVSGWMTIYRKSGDAWTSFPVGGLTPLAAVNLDEDPADELVARGADMGLLVFGLGGDALDAFSYPQDLFVPPPPTVEPGLRGAWLRAEDLVTIGLPEVGAGRLMALAAATPGNLTEGLASKRAAEILDVAGFPAKAIPLYRRAASFPEIAAEAWQALAAMALRDSRPELALEATRARLELPNPPSDLVASRDALIAQLDRPSVTFDFASGVDPALRVLNPAAVRWSFGEGGARLSNSGKETVMSLPVRWDGGSFSLALDATLERGDWATGWSLVLSQTPLDSGARPLMSLSSGWGGDIALRSLHCAATMFQFTPGEQLIGHRVSGRADFTAADGHVTCNAYLDGTEYGHRNMPYDLSSLPHGDLWLELRSDNVEGAAHTLLLRSLSMTGLTVRDLPLSPLDEARRALAMGEPKRALSLLSATDARPESRLTRAVALDLIGDSVEAGHMLQEAARADPTLGGAIATLFAFHLDRFEGPLRQIFGEDYYQKVYQYNGTGLATDADQPALISMVTNRLNGLEKLPRLDVGPVEPLANRVALLEARGVAYRMTGATAASLRDLSLARDAFDQLSRRADLGSGANDIQDELASVEVELALTLAARGELDAAMASALHALTSSRAPEIRADVLATQEGLRPLHTRPGWAEVEEARRLGGGSK